MVVYEESNDKEKVDKKNKDPKMSKSNAALLLS